ncbi:23S rRNA (guanosine(2251)-2'-O)-methyltransferase RlmB [Sulfobacillus thermotolerans]|uniref:23S rRNA (Guanosine(2251)-2'-O)-methyltransferase RlmB n=1 Tax=Sulfobacillus thermotolerans TaxID=338644 RepID=A0ABN5H7L1_9FIRM|nr:23S rRNA (guanosine(2251)-2'-O)-methyltransferase RlmB [Sulfobacillus thermotolerans]
MPLKTHQRDRGSYLSRPRERQAELHQEGEDNILVGRRPVLEALRAGRGIQRLWVLDREHEGSMREIIGLGRERGITIQMVPRAKLDALAGPLNHQGVVAAVSAVPLKTLDDVKEIVAAQGQNALVILLDQIQDPQNLGAIIRVANAAGACAVIVPQHGSAPLSAAVSKAAAGATEYVPVAEVPNLAQAVETLKTWGLFVYAADPEAPIVYTQAQFRGPVALVIGAEGPGLRPLVKKRCDQMVKLPMQGQVASLNAATACAVLAFEVVRQRSAERETTDRK